MPDPTVPTPPEPRPLRRPEPLDVVDAERRLGRVVTELNAITRSLGDLAEGGDIDEAHWVDGIKPPLARALQASIDALEDLVWAIDRPWSVEWAHSPPAEPPPA